MDDRNWTRSGAPFPGADFRYVIRVDLTGGRQLPVFPKKQTFSVSAGMSQRANKRLMHRSNLTAYSITSSARAINAAGISRASVRAAFRLMISRNLVG